MIYENVPDAHVEIFSGRTGAFEITVNGTLIYSRLETHKSPNLEAVLDQVITAAFGQQPEKVTEYKKKKCSIM
ncbi:hypothetical protein PHET_04374 [Paragonimus heterotremus]|uniref:Selenoprotein W n=1 Tax=Paragonimus heterotremus TaxID=100268 RepID=A0A8J4TIR8_9TREM|nr:hypothetical protein PHET_04374 [Paragonimus heterotremus]